MVKGNLFLFIVLGFILVLIGDCARAEEVTHKESLVNICGKIPSPPPVKPVTDDTFDLLGRYRVDIADWMSCGGRNAETERDWKLLSIVRHMSDRWTLLGLQEIQKARREPEPIQPYLPSLDVFEQWEPSSDRRSASGD